MVEMFLNDWNAISQLYQCVLNFSRALPGTCKLICKAKIPLKSMNTWLLDAGQFILNFVADVCSCNEGDTCKKLHTFANWSFSK